MAPGQSKVLIVDDDPSHLEIYGLLIERAGYESYPVLVKFAGADIPADAGIGLILLDYTLHSLRTSTEIAQEIRGLYPQAPIVLLSDLWSMPADISPHITEFVRKGQPARLLETAARLLKESGESLVPTDPASGRPPVTRD